MQVVLCGRHHTLWFMEHIIFCFYIGDSSSVKSYTLRLRIDLTVCFLLHSAVDPDPAFLCRLFYLAAGSDPHLHQKLVQSDHICHYIHRHPG